MTQSNVSDWLSNLLGPVELQADGVPVASRPNLNFGPGLTVTDNGETITIDDTGGAGVTPAGTNGDIQKKNGSALAASGLNDDGTKITTTRPFFAGSACAWDSDGTTCFFGKDQASGNQHTNAGVYASSSAAIGVGTSPYFYAQGGLCQIGQPLVGYSAGSSPYGAVDGEAVIPLTAASHTLSAAEYSVGNVRVTGTGSNTLVFPNGGAGTGAYMRYVHNAGSGTLAIHDVSGAAAGSTLGAGQGAWFKFYNDGAQKVKQLTAAFAVA